MLSFANVSDNKLLNNPKCWFLLNSVGTTKVSGKHCIPHNRTIVSVKLHRNQTTTSCNSHVYKQRDTGHKGTCSNVKACQRRDIFALPCYYNTIANLKVIFQKVVIIPICNFCKFLRRMS